MYSTTVFWKIALPSKKKKKKVKKERKKEKFRRVSAKDQNKMGVKNLENFYFYFTFLDREYITWFKVRMI